MHWSFQFLYLCIWDNEAYFVIVQICLPIWNIAFSFHMLPEMTSLTTTRSRDSIYDDWLKQKAQLGCCLASKM